MHSYCIYPDNNAVASDNLSGVSFLIDLAKTAPFAQFLVIIDLKRNETKPIINRSFCLLYRVF